MTTQRDADRILRAWLDLMPDEAPDRIVAEILEDVALTTQARPSLIRLPRVSPTMGRVVLIAATVLLGAALLGGALLAGSSPSRPPSPTAPTGVTGTASPAARLR